MSQRHTLRELTLALLLIAMALLAISCGGRTRGQITGVDAPPDAVPDLAGAYALNGLDALGAEYGGSLIITAGAAAGEYRLQWLITEGILEGAGMLSGNKLTVTWQTRPGSPSPLQGTAAYTVTTKGELYGARTITGVATPAAEKAFPNH